MQTLSNVEAKAERRRPAARGHNFPDVWLGLRGLVTRMDTLVSTYRADLAERDQRIMELQGIAANQSVVIDQLVNARAEIQAEFQHVQEQLVVADQALEARADALNDTIATEVRALRTELQGNIEVLVANSGEVLDEQRQAHETSVAARVALEALVTGLQERVDRDFASLQEQVCSNAQRAGAINNDVASKFNDVEDAIAAAAARTEENRVELVGLGTRLQDVAARSTEARDLAAAGREDLTDQNAAITRLEARAEQLETDQAAGRTGIETTTAAIEQLEILVQNETSRTRLLAEEACNAVAEEFRLLQVESRAWISALPKNLIVDSRGNLIGVTGQGDLVEVGHVAGDPGRDGATIEAVELLDGQLFVVMTDGRRLLAGKIPLAPAAEPVEASPQVRARELKAAGTSGREIAEQLGVSRRTVSRWLKDDSNS